MRAYSDQPDRWIATVVPDREGLWTYQVEAWDDPIGTWHHAVEVKVEAGQGPTDLANDLEEGARLLDEVGKTVPREHRSAVAAAAVALRDEGLELSARLAPALAPAMTDLLDTYPVRRMVTRSPRYEVWVDRVTALFGSWYEFFPARRAPSSTAGPPTAPSPTRRSGCRRSRRWSSTSSTCRRSTRSARSTARARTTPSPPRTATSARPGPSAAPTAGTTRCTRSWAPWPTSRPSSPAPGSWGWRWRWTSRCRPPPTTRG
ncbi:maltotransferase domain-containing protein [Klenkia terrae]|uniref:maltotransferase domain-containing protein n=1 Tax=Klenkia terrae TaxID=1052259 RepID=UPI00361966BE